MARIAEMASELAYDVVDLNYSNGPGPDLQLKNPKTNRLALVEVEVTFQQQVSHKKKYRKRIDAIAAAESQGTSTVLLVVGVKRRDLLALLKRAGVASADSTYGVTVFSAVSAWDQAEIRAVLLRSLGGA